MTLKESDVNSNEQDSVSSILEEAHNLVRHERQSEYDHPLYNYQRIAKVMSVILEPVLKEGAEVDFRQAILCMEAVKLVREAHRPKRDNRRDGAGYWDVLQWAIEESESKK
jgi:hypothetical protein